jgi:hypothetical protein
MKPRHLLPIFYLLAVILAFIKCTSEGYWGTGTSASLLLTLPWSFSMMFFAWALIHDGARSLLIFLIPFAGLNLVLLFKMPVWFGKSRRGGNPAKQIVAREPREPVSQGDSSVPTSRD